MRRLLMLGVTVLALGCTMIAGIDEEYCGPETLDAEVGGSSGETGGAGGTVSHGSTTAASGGVGGAGGDAAHSVCGNGVIEPGEACDDGNDVEGDACSSDCRCGGDQIEFKAFSNGSCYLIGESPPLTWPDARSSCEALGMHLATISDEDELLFVSGKFNQLWLGGQDQSIEGQYEWVSGEPWTCKPGSCGLWASGQPNNDASDLEEGQDCIMMEPDISSKVMFNDKECSELYPFVCEIKP